MLGMLKSWTSGLDLSWGGFFSQGASLPALGSNCWPTWEMLGVQLIAAPGQLSFTVSHEMTSVLVVPVT